MAEALELRAITNHGYYTDYFLTYRATSGLADLFKSWKEQEKTGAKTARSRVAGLGRTFDQYRNSASELTPDESTGVVDPSVAGEKAHKLLIDETLAAFGWHVPGPVDGDQDGTVDHTERGVLSVARGGTEHHIPVGYARTLPTGPLLVAIDLVFSEDPEAVTSDRTNPEARLLAPATTGTGAGRAGTLHELADLLFGCDTPPRYLLACTGATLILLDRDSWYEGAWLAVNLDALLASKDASPSGETAIAAALFGTATLDPGNEPTNLHDKLRADAARHGAGVSKELRRGMRRAVEALAQAVVHDLHERQHANVLSNPQLDRDLTRQTLRYLYRLIVLLYAEAHPELGILPARAPEYHDGYGLERLRHLSGVRLESEAARRNNHIQQSLAILFRAVNDGHNQNSGSMFEDGRSLTFSALRSKLFDDDACPLIDRAIVPDETMQKVIGYLCFTEPKPGKRRESISFATLDVPQIGAVYEGLMSWTGTVATELLYEVDRDGDPDNGSWTIPAHQLDQYPDSAFILETDEHGRTKRVQYERYDFVYRLAGRDRERAAAFYTPRVLTEFTIRHTLDEFFLANPGITADELLSITICEPALGSGAFVNEAVTQLAGHYLRLRQEELGETIPAEDYAAHEQRAKAHFAINQAYGVDLNEGGIELAEVSMWLNCMHAGLPTPRLDARLRHGNSLIGARRATYTADQVKRSAYTGKNAVAPTEHSLQSVPLGTASGIHHFLLPGEGWGAAADATELKGKGGKRPSVGLAADWAESVNNWRRVIAAKPTAPQLARLQALAERVEIAWQAAADASTRFHASTRQNIDGLYGTSPLHDFPRNDIARNEFHDPDSPAGRLRTLMDGWCALWMWAPANGTALPTLEQWIDAAELLLGRPSSDQTGELFTAQDIYNGRPGSDERIGRAGHSEILDRHPWLTECQAIASTQAFFHWELEHAPVFKLYGGFHITVGNPPWVRPRWNEHACLAEHDAWWGVVDLGKIGDSLKKARQDVALQSEALLVSYRRERAENQGFNALLSAATREPALVGIQTNLYMLFITNTWRRASSTGTVGLLHPESHFVDPNAGPFRSKVYARLRRHWQFNNEQKVFADVGESKEFGVNVYGSPRPQPVFIQASNLLNPSMLDASLVHDGTGPLPGIKHPDGTRDERPHRARIVGIDSGVLGEWVHLFDLSGTAFDQSRLLRPLTTEDLTVLSLLAKVGHRLADTPRYWTRGFDEDKLKSEGTGVWHTEIAASIGECILQGPHLLNGTPFGQQPRPVVKSNNDWDPVDLESLPVNYVPRSNYQRSVSTIEFAKRQTRWGDTTYTAYYREAHREFVAPDTSRTMQAAVLPPGPTHVNAVNSIARTDNRATVRWTGLLMSLPIDYLVKTSGSAHLNANFTDALPLPAESVHLDRYLLVRTLRLNCLTADYASLWAELFTNAWTSDSFVETDSWAGLGDVVPEWAETTPLRRDYDRWLASCEIDAIAALLLGLSEEQLVQMYRSQFGLLREYEHCTVFDREGRSVVKSGHAWSARQRSLEERMKAAKSIRGEKRMGMWARVQAFLAGDESVDLGPYVPPFRPADRETVMRHAYRVFEARLSRNAS